MTTYNLINTLKYGSGTLKSGSLIDSTSHNVSQVAHAGGLLVATGLNATLDAVSREVEKMWAAGKDQESCDTLMLGAYAAYIQAYAVAHDTIGNESAHTHAIPAGVAPAITCDKQRLECTVVPSAPGGNYHAQFAAGAAIDHALAPGDQLIVNVPSRCVQIARGGAGNPTAYTITGTDDSGTVITDVINSAGAATVQGAKAFATIARIQSDVDPGVTTDLQVGKGFGLGGPVSDVDALGCDGVADTIVSSHAATGAVVPTTAPDGTKRFTVRYRVLPTATNAAHTHTGTSGAGSAHTHALT